MKKKSKNDEKLFKYYHDSIVIFLQVILTLAVMVVGIISIFKKGSFFLAFEIITSLLMFLMAYNNYKIYRKEKLTIIYVITGLLIVGSLIVGVL